MSDDFTYGPEISFFNLLSNHPKEVKEFFQHPGSTIKANLSGIKTLHDPTFINHAVVPFSNIIEDEHEEFETEKDFISLIEHLATGHFYILFEDFDYDDSYGIVQVADFDGSVENPYNVSTIITPWKETDIRSQGTRAGGWPLSSDGSDYKGLWPHFEDEPLPFMAQFRLDNGKYVHAFVDPEKDGCYLEKDGANCVIMENGPVPSWIEMKAVENPVLFYSKTGFKPAPTKSGKVATADWIQEEEFSENPDDKFIMQIGYRTMPNIDEFMFGDCGDYYIFFNEKLGKGHLVAQCF